MNNNYQVGEAGAVIRVSVSWSTGEHALWGLVTSVLSFRNDSNGYYGGSMNYVGTEMPVHVELIDVVSDQTGD